MDHYDTWTDERLALLKENYETHSMQEVAAIINNQTGSNFTKNAIIGKVHRLDGYQPSQPGTRKPKAATQPRLRFVSRTVSESHKLHAESLAVFLGIPFMELHQKDCRYPRGEGDEILFCGQPQERGSYCLKCYQLTHMRAV